MKILFVGDVMGEPGREFLIKTLPAIKKNENIDFIIVNGENSAGGKGLTEKVASEIFNIGVDVITLGNHTWARKEIETIINEPHVLRPANYPEGVPGNRYGIYTLEDNTTKIGVINIMGRVYMPILECPFRTADEIINRINKETKNIVIDFHAEITSEKQALGWYLDGKASAVVGTHTHVMTADQRILPNGTAYITDIGMCGSIDSIIGMDKEIILKKYLTGMPFRFSVAKDNLMLSGCIIEIDTNTGKSLSIKPIQIKQKKES